MGTSGDYAPFSIERGGSCTGFDVDVARLFARDLGRRLEVVPFRWPDLERDLAAGRFELAMGGITMRPERALAGSFTRPVATTGAVVLVPGGGPRTRAALDTPSLRLAVNAGGHLEHVARRFLPHASLVLAPDSRGLAALILAGRADAVLTDDAEAPLLVPALAGATRVGPLTRDRKAYLGRDPGLVASLDAWLRDREADGTLAALRTRWLGPGKSAPRSRFASDLDALLALLDLRLGLMPAVAAAKEKAGLPVDDPPQEERVLAAARAAARRDGVDEETVAQLFLVQVEVARDTQRAFLDTPPAERPPVAALDLQGEARPALAAISEAIVARAADVACEPSALALVDRSRAAAALDPGLAPPSARRALAEAVLSLRMAVQEPTFVKQPGLG